LILATDITDLITALQGVVSIADHSLPNRICIQAVTLFVAVFMIKRE